MKVDIDAADNHDMCRSSLIQFDGHRVSSQSNKIIVCSGLKYLLGHACHALRFCSQHTVPEECLKAKVLGLTAGASD